MASLITKAIGGYFSLWLVAIASTMIMLLFSFILSIFTEEASILQMVYFLYNGSVSIFILILSAPIGFGMIVIIPIWNGVNDFIAPLLAVIIDPIFGGLAKILGTVYTPFKVTGVIDQSSYQFTISFMKLLNGFTDLLFTEVVG
jgi:hypothetical protein